MSNLIEFAKQEFKLLGYKPIDELPKDNPDRWIQENIFELLNVFKEQGHSGFSAPFVINYFKRLVMFEPLSPITSDDDEWQEVGDNTYQNKRLSALFKKGKEGKPYFLDAIVWREKIDDDSYTSFTGNVMLETGETILSRQYVKLPFIEKTFYVDVSPIDDGTYKLLKPQQLDEVFKYYIKYDYENQ